VAFPAIKNVERQDCQKKIIEHKMFVFSLQLLPEIFLLRRIEPDMIKMYIGLHVKYQLFLSDFEGSFHILDRFPKNTQI